MYVCMCVLFIVRIHMSIVTQVLYAFTRKNGGAGSRSKGKRP